MTSIKLPLEGQSLQARVYDIQAKLGDDWGFINQDNFDHDSFLESAECYKEVGIPGFRTQSRAEKAVDFLSRVTSFPLRIVEIEVIVKVSRVDHKPSVIQEGQ